jgi:hypothetical protein
VSIWRLEPGTVIAPEVLAAPEVRCVLKGSTVYDGKLMDEKACYYIPEDRRTQPVESPGGAELLVISLPMYVRATWEAAQGIGQIAA